MGQLILASASPRRKELLEQIGVPFEVCPAKGEEIITNEAPEDVVVKLSTGKAREVAAMLNFYRKMHKDIMTPQDILVIGADTVVFARGRILGKPKDENEAYDMLAALSGRTHTVYTGVAFVFLSSNGRIGEHTFYEETNVTLLTMTEDEIRRYIATGEPMDKAGAYGIQGKFAIYVAGIRGDYNNVVGLPVSAIYRELRKLGIDLYRFTE